MQKVLWQIKTKENSDSNMTVSVFHWSIQGFMNWSQTIFAQNVYIFFSIYGTLQPHTIISAIRDAFLILLLVSNTSGFYILFSLCKLQ